MKALAFLVLILAASAFAGPADYNAVSGYGTRITGGAAAQVQIVNIFPGLDGPFYDAEDSEVKLENIALASEVNEGNGFIRLRFTLTFRNAGPGYYEELFIEWERVDDDWKGVQVGDVFPVPDLIPYGTSSRPQPFEIRVPAASRDAAVEDVLAGLHLRPVGIELFQFSKPAVAVDAATDGAFSGYVHSAIPGAEDVTFRASTPLLAALQPGTLLVESLYGGYALKRPPPNGLLSDLVAAAEAADPNAPGNFTPPKVLEVISIAPQGDGSIIVTGKSVEFDKVLDTGSFFQRPLDALNLEDGGPPLRDIYRPPAGDNYLSYFEQPNQGPPPSYAPLPVPGLRSPKRLNYYAHHLRGYGVRAIHVPINNLTMFNGVTLDGEMLLEALNIELKVRYHGLVPRKISMKVASKAELTLRLSAGANSNNKNRPLEDQEKNIFAIPLPEIVFSIGPVPIEIAPIFKGKVGVVVDAPTNIVIPIHGSVESGCVMGWNADRPPGDQYYFRPFSKAKPLVATNPLLNDSLKVTASAFAEAGVEVQVNRSAGPYAGARVTANFELNPAQDPWWSLDFDFQTHAEFRLSLLGFNLAKIGDTVSDVKRILHKDPAVAVPRGSGLPGGSPPAPFDPVSGGETRWVRKSGTFPGAMKVARVAGTDEDVFTITEALVVSPPITRIGAKGDVIWSKGAQLVAPQRMAATADGGLVFVSGGSSALVVWMDGAGNPVAARTFRPQDSMGNGQLFYIGAILSAPTGETYVIGIIAASGPDQDPFIVKYDANHDFVFAKRYETPNTVEYITDAALHPNGDLIICGNSDGRPNVALFPDFEFANLQGALLMRVTPAGDFVWGNRALPSFRFNSVTVAPDGTIYTAGQFLRTVVVPWPAMLVCRHDPTTGIPSFLATYGETVENANPVVQGLNGDVIPGAGFTPYDAATSIEWSPNGLIVGSNTAELPDVNTRAPLVMCLTEQFSVRWWSSHQSDGADDGIFDLVPTAQGIFTAGFSRGLGASDVNNDPAPAVMMKLPLEGKLDFGSPAGKSNFLVPAIKQVPGYAQIYPGIASPPHGYLGTEALPFTVISHPFATANVTPPTFSDVSIDYSAPLQRDTTDAPMQNTVTTLEADASRTTATLHGIADALGASGTARFEWGTAMNALTNVTPPIQIRRGQRNVDISAALTGLTENTQYFFRARLDAGGTTLYGEPRNFRSENHAPVAVSDLGLRVPAVTPSVLAVLANDSDPDGDALTITAISSPPGNGTATISPDGKSIIFDPDDDYTGNEAFNYKISDGNIESGPTFISFNIGLERPSSPLLTQLAASGDAVPDPTLANAFITTFGTPAIGDAGAITATMGTRIGRTSGTGIFLRDQNGEASVLARSGNSPGGMPGVTFSSFGDPAISPGGAVAFTAKVKGRGINPANDDGLWTNLGGGLRRIIAEGGTLPFLGTARVAQITSFSIRDGEILALIKLKAGNGVNTTNDSTFVRITPDGNGVILAREGSAVSTNDTALVSRISTLMPALGSNGHARTHGDGGFVAKIKSAAPDREKLVAYETDGTPTTLLTTNTNASTFGAGVKWDRFGLPAIDTTGSAWTAHATLKLGGTTTNTDTALIFHDATANPLTIIAQENDPAPDTTANFSGFLDPLVNSDFNIAFTATLRGTGVTRANAAGIWSGAATAPALTARTGDAATGTNGDPLVGVTWKSFTTQALPGLGGGPVFLATLSGTGVTAANKTALFAQDTAGNVRQLLRTGTVFGSKTISTISLLNAANGPFDGSRSFNQQGTIALRLTFTDRSQALVRIEVP